MSIRGRCANPSSGRRRTEGLEAWKRQSQSMAGSVERQAGAGFRDAGPARAAATSSPAHNRAARVGGQPLPSPASAAMTAAITTLTGAGATVVEVRVPTYNDWSDAEFQVLLYEFKDGLNA